MPALRHCLAITMIATAFAAGAVAPVPAFAVVTAQSIYEGLLTRPLPNPPPDRTTPAIPAVPSAALPTGLRPGEKASAFLGGVRITFAGDDPAAQLTYYVFTEPSGALDYHHAYTALPPKGTKSLAYPPFAQCADRQGGSYCEMMLLNNAVIMTASAATISELSKS